MASATSKTRGWDSRAMTEPIVHNMRDVPNCHSLPPPWHALHEEFLVRIFFCTTMNVRPFICTHGTSAAGGSNIRCIVREGPFTKLMTRAGIITGNGFSGDMQDAGDINVNLEPLLEPTSATSAT